MAVLLQQVDRRLGLNEAVARTLDDAVARRVLTI